MFLQVFFHTCMTTCHDALLEVPEPVPISTAAAEHKCLTALRIDVKVEPDFDTTTARLVPPALWQKANVSGQHVWFVKLFSCCD